MGNTALSQLVFDREAAQLMNDGREIKLRPMVFRLLELFIERTHKLLKAEEILNSLWPNSYVTEGLVREYVHDLRKALGDDANHPNYIETVHGRGYRYLGGIINRSSNRSAYVGFPSIMVLPFVDLSHDTAKNFYSHSLAIGISARLCKFPSLLVVTSQAISAQTMDQKEEFSVRYILQGSVEKIDNKVQINVWLVDATSNQQLWAECYRRKRQDDFSVRHEIAHAVAINLMGATGTLARIEHSRIVNTNISHLGAYDYLLQARKVVNNSSEASSNDARILYHKAIEQEAGFASAYRGIAATYLIAVVDKWSGDIDGDLELAYESIQRAISLDDSHYGNDIFLAVYHLYKHNHHLAKVAFDKAYEANPNDAELFVLLALYDLYDHRSQDAVNRIQKAIDLNPYHPIWYQRLLCWALFDASQFKASIAIMELIVNPPQWVSILIIVAYIELLEPELAIRNSQRLLKDYPDFNLKDYERYLQKTDPYKKEFRNKQLLKTLSKALNVNL